MQLIEYFSFIFRRFFWNWWTLITGLASLIGFVTIPKDFSLQVGRGEIILAFGVGLTGLFLVITVVIQSWQLYIKSLSSPRVVEWRKAEKDSGHQWVFVLQSALSLDIGQLIALYTIEGSIKIFSAMLEVTDAGPQNDKWQCKEVWISPAVSEGLSGSPIGENKKSLSTGGIRCSLHWQHNDIARTRK